MDANTTGANNTALGTSALYSNTTANNNVAVGYQSLIANTTANANVAIGKHSLYSNTTGADNVAVGTNSLFNNTTGDTNTALGNDALKTNTTATQNTCVGGNAGALTNGGSNTYVGYYSGKDSDSGTYNTAIGHYAFSSDQNGTTSGSYNTCLGSRTGQVISTGNKNVLIGWEAGKGIQDGSDNVCIGPEAGGTGQIASGDNQLYIARNNTGANNAATWIYGNTNGSCYQGNNSSTWSTSSDIRLKKDIVDSPKGLNEINQLRVTNFYYKEENEIDMSEFPLAKEPSQVCLADEDKGGKLQTGLIAQEIEKVLPECIKESVQGVKTVDSDPIQWAMIKAIQELSAKVTALEGN